jgi:hypothetical protein
MRGLRFEAEDNRRVASGKEQQTHETWKVLLKCLSHTLLFDGDLESSSTQTRPLGDLLPLALPV